jgi:hypothetical protein
MVGGASTITSAKKSTIPTQTTTDMLTAILCLGVVMICLYTIQTVLTKPIPTDTVLQPGTIKTKCGIVGYIPTIVKDVTKTLLEPFHPNIHTSDGLLNCRNEILEVRSDGTVTLSDDQGNVVVSFNGDVCYDGKKDCINGLVLQDNLMIKIGTKIVKAGTYHYYDNNDSKYPYNKNIILSPWPFAEEPKLKIKRQRS